MKEEGYLTERDLKAVLGGVVLVSTLLGLGFFVWVFREHSWKRADVEFRNDSNIPLYVRYMNSEASVDRIEPGKSLVLKSGYARSDGAWYQLSCDKSSKSGTRVNLDDFAVNSLPSPVVIQLSQFQACASQGQSPLLTR